MPEPSTPYGHEITVLRASEDGGLTMDRYASCECGWMSYPVADPADAADDGIAHLDSVASPPVNHHTHWFAETWDGDTIRCADCEVLYGGLRSGQPCPAAATRRVE